jgi:hypothetical protein
MTPIYGLIRFRDVLVLMPVLILVPVPNHAHPVDFRQAVLVPVPNHASWYLHYATLDQEPLELRCTRSVDFRSLTSGALSRSSSQGSRGSQIYDLSQARLVPVPNDASWYLHNATLDQEPLELRCTRSVDFPSSRPAGSRGSRSRHIIGYFVKQTGLG